VLLLTELTRHPADVRSGRASGAFPEADKKAASHFGRDLSLNLRMLHVLRAFPLSA
jgi:hypothetical protein